MFTTFPKIHKYPKYTKGAVANAISAIAAHYPWFYTYNFLNKSPIIHVLIKNNLLRNAGIGFVSSIISDSIANVVRVIKTTKQAFGSKHCVSYGEVIAMILAADGWKVNVFSFSSLLFELYHSGTNLITWSYLIFHAHDLISCTI